MNCGQGFPLPRFLILVSVPAALFSSNPSCRAAGHCLPCVILGKQRVIPAQETVQLASGFPGAIAFTHFSSHFFPAATPQHQACVKCLDQFAERNINKCPSPGISTWGSLCSFFLLISLALGLPLLSELLVTWGKKVISHKR